MTNKKLIGAIKKALRRLNANMKIINIVSTGSSLYGLDSKGNLYLWQYGRPAFPDYLTTGRSHPAIQQGWKLLENEIIQEDQKMNNIWQFV